MYRDRVRALLSPRERAVFGKLSTPERIQDYLERMAINFEQEGETIRSPRRALKARKAHCMEGAFLAAASLAYHGHPPLLMDLRTRKHDYDHVVALFRRDGLWGAISKTNHATLRWRDPVYRTPRELAMSYFHEYFLETGEKTLLEHSEPFDLRRYKPEEWVTAEEDLDDIVIALDDSPHLPFAPKRALGRLRRATPVERRAMELVEKPYPRNWKEPGREKKTKRRTKKE